jgi:hypothetical protein
MIIKYFLFKNTLKYFFIFLKLIYKFKKKQYSHINKQNIKKLENSFLKSDWECSCGCF